MVKAFSVLAQNFFLRCKRISGNLEKTIPIFIFLLCLSLISKSQISLTGGYFQDFNTLATSGTSSTVPAGWLFVEAGSQGDNQYTADNGSISGGDTYSYGTGTNTDRAFGSLNSSNNTPTIGASFTNNMGAALGTILISYTGEQWRLGNTGRVDQLDFEYSLNATSLTTGTWTSVNTLDFTAPVTAGTVGALDGNNSANRVSVVGAITGVNIPNGSTFFIRWSSFPATGNDDGLGIDNFSIGSYFLQVNFGNFRATELLGGIQVEWSNLTESNIDQYRIERSVNGIDFSVAGTISPQWNNGGESSYQFLDASPLGNINFYRIRAIEMGGSSKYSMILRVDLRKVSASLVIYPNPVRDGIISMQLINLPSGNYTAGIFSMEGQLLISKELKLQSGSFSQVFHLPASCKPGVYYFKVTGTGVRFHQTFVLQR